MYNVYNKQHAFLHAFSASNVFDVGKIFCPSKYTNCLRCEIDALLYHYYYIKTGELR